MVGYSTLSLHRRSAGMYGSPPYITSSGAPMNGSHKRTYAGSARDTGRYRKKSFRRGYSRTGGYYGRFNGIDGELKFHDVDLNDAQVAANGVVTDSINLIAQGITESTRNGRKCTIKTLQWRYRITLPELVDQATPGNPTQVRIIVYVDHQCNGATAAVLDILETADIHSFRNLSNSQRFTILMDKQHVLNYLSMAGDGAGTTAQAFVFREYTWYKKCNIPLEFNSTTGAITEIRSNNVGVILLSSDSIAGFDSKWRLRFSDASRY